MKKSDMVVVVSLRMIMIYVKSCGEKSDRGRYNRRNVFNGKFKHNYGLTIIIVITLFSHFEPSLGLFFRYCYNIIILSELKLEELTGHKMFMNILNQKDKQGHFQCLDHRQDKQASILF